jgi:PhnB protein
MTPILEGETKMTGLAPYLLFDGTARAALKFYAETFDGSAELHSFAEFDRDDGPAERIAHGHLLTPHLSPYAADVGTGNDPSVARGIMLSLLGTAEPVTLHRWFDRLSQDGSTIQPLEERPWGASDGQVLDRFGVHWLLGYETEPPA